MPIKLQAKKVTICCGHGDYRPIVQITSDKLEEKEYLLLSKIETGLVKDIVKAITRHAVDKETYSNPRLRENSEDLYLRAVSELNKLLEGE